MHEAVKRNSDLLVASGIAVLVLLLWTALLGVAARTYFLGSTDGIAALGQLGDSFGLLNALFTGITLAGLVYTAFVQQSQMKEQQKAIRAQEQDNELHRQAQSRQARAQFLTARLNAQTALVTIARYRFT